MFEQYDIDLLREYETKGLITGRNHPNLPLVVWNYTAATQYGRLWDAITLSTRGVVTDLQGRTVAMCIPKFFNLAETDHTIEDFAVAQEKLDGSLIHIFWYDGRWVCSSRGSFESDHAGWAQELVDENSDFFKAYEDEPAVTFVCELIVPENRIVVDYGDEKSLRLISRFWDAPGVGWLELDVSTWPVGRWPWAVVETFTLDEALGYLEQSGVEGVVLLDGNGNRVKVKTDEYVEHHRIVTGLTTKNVLEHFLEHGNVDKLLEFAPDEWYERIGQLAWDFQTRKEFLESCIRMQFHNVVQGLPKDCERKDFAMEVKGQRNTGYMFALLDGKSIDDMLYRDVLDNREAHGLEL